MSLQNKVALTVFLIATAVFGGAFLYQGLAVSERTESEESESARRSSILRDDSHRLGTAEDGKVTVVEFLDFECESCGAVFPFIEKLRESYKNRVTFVARYFPLPGHRNALNAAHAVEAAARQGKFDEMYKRLFETQGTWGENQESKASLFRSYAQHLGLDMEIYDRDVKSPSVAERVQSDMVDGKAAGVSGTPAFFLNGKRFVPATAEEFIQALNSALAK